MKVLRIRPGESLPPGLAGAILCRDLRVGGDPWAKGRRLTDADLGRLATGPVGRRGAWAGAGRDPAEITLLLPDPADLHEDEAAIRIASAISGPGLVAGAPAESRVDLRARVDGVVRVRTAALARLARLDGISAFTILDGRAVVAGSLVASVKTGPHLVPAALVERACRIGALGGPLVDLLPYRPIPLAAAVREHLAPAARERFAAGLAARATGLGARLAGIADLPDDPAGVAAALGGLARGPARGGVILVAGAASTDPADPVLLALARLGADVVSHGVPAHPGSMLLLARLSATAIVALPTCGAYSRATAADLLLPWLAAGAPPTRATVARLAHGGILDRDQRHRFPPYARALPDPGEEPGEG